MEDVNEIADTNPLMLIIERIFNAPRDMVFNAWVDQEMMAGWSCPQGFTIPFGESDVRSGGKWRTCMVSPDGVKLWLGGVWKEIDPPKRLSFTHAWEDKNGNPQIESLVTVVFEDLGDKTKMIFQQTGFSSKASRDGHEDGWNECFDKLVSYLGL